MRTRILYFLLNSGKNIKDKNIPSCKNCKCYKPEDSILKTNNCEKTDVKDISDKIKYDYADVSIKDEKDGLKFRCRRIKPEKKS